MAEAVVAAREVDFQTMRQVPSVVQAHGEDGIPRLKSSIVDGGIGL
ncbi:MAG: hypothetical protein BWY79_02172 [Actinobacteria bacterium ADurb.Bin444]|nr:MAG: hypothetical protein BWY79_02172 [Actinobacteria bacterium ADurb.Bin444]